MCGCDSTKRAQKYNSMHLYNINTILYAVTKISVLYCMKHFPCFFQVCPGL